MVSSISLAFPIAASKASPFAAPAARTPADAPGTPPSQGAFSAHLTLSLYDEQGRARTIEDGPASLRGARLARDEAAVIQVQDPGGRDLTVTVRKDGTFAASSSTPGGTVRYDSRDGAPQDAATKALAARAAGLVSLAASAGTASGLSAAAAGVVASVQPVIGQDASAEGLVVTVSDAGGTSRYVGGAGGTVSASRTTADIALEAVTVDGGIVTDSVRKNDGSGTTTVDGGALAGTRFVVTRAANGVEAFDVTSGNGGGVVSDSAALAAVDAFGERISILGGAGGVPKIALTDSAGTSVTFDAGQIGSDASLSVSVAVGGLTGTARASLTEDATATTVTGSSIRASSALVAGEAKTGTGEPDAGRSGTLMLRLDQQTFASSGVQNGIATTSADAGLQVHAQAAGSLTVAGTAAAAAGDGYIDPHGIQHVAGGVDRTASGSAALDRAAPRSIVDITVDARDKEQHAIADVKKQNAYTQDDALLSVEAFGHSAGAMRTDSIWQHDNHATFASSESLL
ncbi:MAG: hypothetical protein JWN27_3147 [Candidatus Eremiobacteraeota bacterium]|nr:hypothetical protein [Candidatus Eremiobacteraeota bacterium]